MRLYVDPVVTFGNTLQNARNAALQRKLQEAQAQIKSYAEKSRQQDRAIATASKELLRLQNTIRQLERQNGVTKPGSKEESMTNVLQELQAVQLTLEAEKLKLEKELVEKQTRSLEYETECIKLRRRVIELEEEARRLKIVSNHTLADLFQVNTGSIDFFKVQNVLTAATKRSIECFRLYWQSYSP